MPTTSDPSANSHVRTRFFVFMGVCGVGKSTVAQAAANEVGGFVVDADDLHSAENIKAMSEGRPLTDDQRWPWLDVVCTAALKSPMPVMIACSALRLTYRDFIRARLEDAVFLHLDGPPDLIRERMMLRRAHFMSPAMLDGQLSILEAPVGERNCHRVDISGPLSETVARAANICRHYLDASAQSGLTGEADQIKLSGDVA